MEGVLKMKNLQPFCRVKLIFFCIIFLFLSASLNAQFADSLALFIVADAVNPNAAENEIILRLENMDFDVGLVGQDETGIEAMEYASLVLISATVSSGTVADNMPGLMNLAIPIINWEPFLNDSLGHQATEGGEFNTDSIEIVNEDHPLAAGLSNGLVVITTVEKAVSYGVPQGDVVIIAVNAAVDTQAVLFGYDTGAAMYVGTAPARRVGTFLLNDVADAMTDEGWALFDASVMWAMGAEEPTHVKDLALDIPEQFMLHHNYPNPFNPMTHIVFSIPIQTNVRLSIYNTIGQNVATLVDEVRPAGNYTVTFNASDISSGVYYYRLETGYYTAIKKMLFLK